MSSVIDLLATSPALFVGIAGLLGLIVGSFLNVVIYRLPIILERQWREQCADPPAAGAAAMTVPALSAARFNLIVPRSACPACRAPIRARQNVPLLSYLLLQGRCANCGAAISARYPLVEALTGILTAAVAWKFGFGCSALAAAVLTWFLIALTFIDLDHQLLPDNLTLPLLWLGLCASLWLPPSAAATVPVDVHSSLIGAVAGYVSLWSVYHLFRLFTGKDGMGYGDFKLFAALGAWFGWQMLLPIILFASAAGAVIGIAMLAMRKRQRATPIAFGPFLAAAGWLMLLFGQQLVADYLPP